MPHCCPSKDLPNYFGLALKSLKRIQKKETTTLNHTHQGSWTMDTLLHHHHLFFSGRFFFNDARPLATENHVSKRNITSSKPTEIQSIVAKKQRKTPRPVFPKTRTHHLPRHVRNKCDSFPKAHWTLTARVLTLQPGFGTSNMSSLRVHEPLASEPLYVHFERPNSGVSGKPVAFRQL